MFDKKVALVTGGTSGIGREIVSQFLQKGAYVFVNYYSNEENKKEADLLFSKISSNYQFIKADVSDEMHVKNMMSFIEKEKGCLDFVVNNAGINEDAFIETYDINVFQRIWQVNFLGKVLITKCAIPLLKKSEYPSIVNISSRLGLVPCEEASAYCSAAAAIHNFTKSSAMELSHYRIRVNCVSPGLTITPLAMKGWSKEEIDDQKKNNPMKRLGNTEDIANTVLFLLSREASYITGENINVNGGSLMD